MSSTSRNMRPPPGGEYSICIEKAAKALARLPQHVSIVELARVLIASGLPAEDAKAKAQMYYRRKGMKETEMCEGREYLLEYVRTCVYQVARELQALPGLSQTGEVPRSIIEDKLADRIGLACAKTEIDMYFEDPSAPPQHTYKYEALTYWHDWKTHQHQYLMGLKPAPPQITDSGHGDHEHKMSHAAKTHWEAHHGSDMINGKHTMQTDHEDHPFTFTNTKSSYHHDPSIHHTQVTRRLGTEKPVIKIISKFAQHKKVGDDSSPDPLKYRTMTHNFNRGPLKLKKMTRALFDRQEVAGARIIGLLASMYNDERFNPLPRPAPKNRKQRAKEAEIAKNPAQHRMDHVANLSVMLDDSLSHTSDLLAAVNSKTKSSLTKDGVPVTDTPLYITVIEFDEQGVLALTERNKHLLKNDLVYEIVIDSTSQRLLRGIGNVQGRTWKEEWDALNPTGAKEVSTETVMNYYNQVEADKEELLREMFGSDLKRIQTEMVDLKDWNEILLELFYRTNTANKGVVTYQQFMLTLAQALEQLNLKGRVELPSTAFPFHAIEPQNSKKAIAAEPVKEAEPPAEVERPPSGKKKKGKSKKKKKK